MLTFIINPKNGRVWSIEIRDWREDRIQEELHRWAMYHAPTGVDTEILLVRNAANGSLLSAIPYTISPTRQYTIKRNSQ